MLYNHLMPPPAYPKRKYARSGGSVLVYNSVEETQLGVNWTDTPPPELTVTVPVIDQPEPEPVKRGPGRPRKTE